MKLSVLSGIPALFVVGLMTASNAVADFSQTYEGHQVFNTYCYICHGTDGKGNGPLAGKLLSEPSNLTNNTLLSQKSDRELTHIIQGTAPHGAVSGNMPRWNLAIGGSQIKSLVAYIRFLHTNKHGLIGDPGLGKKVHENKCALCHGDDGEGDGVLTSVIPMKPANHTDARKMDKISNERLKEIVTNGTSGAGLMPGFKGILSEEEIDGVVSYVRMLSADK